MAAMLLLPLIAAQLGKLTGLAAGPLFIVPVFTLVIAMARTPRNGACYLRKASDHHLILAFLGL